MFEDEQAAAVKYYTRIMTIDDVLVLKSLVSRIPRASKSARRYLEGHCRNARELEEFFEDNSYLFFVENGRVALYREELERSSRSAVLFFKEKVGSYRDPVHYMKLKQEQLGAPVSTSKKLRLQMESQDVLTYLNSIIKEGVVHRLKSILKEIQNDYENSSDHLLRHCNSVTELESYLGDFSYLFMVENGKVSRVTDELESGRENADGFFEKALSQHPGAVKIEEFRKHVEDAPSDVQAFIRTFYHPETEFKRYLKLRPHIFVVSKKTSNNSSVVVSLVARECVAFFQKALKAAGEGLRYTSLRGHVGQAPDHVRDYVNAKYPTTEFRYFLEDNSHAFQLKANGGVYLVR